MTAESRKFDEVPARRFQKLPLSAEIVDSALALVAWLTKPNHEKIILRYSLPVDVHDVVETLSHGSASAERMLGFQPVPIT